jgi:hypothetical protein
MKFWDKEDDQVAYNFVINKIHRNPHILYENSTSIKTISVTRQLKLVATIN